MSKTLQYILTLIALLSSVFGVYFYVDARYALAAEFKKLEQRLEYKIQSDQLNSVQERIWKIEDRYGKKSMDQTAKEEYKKLQVQRDELKGKVQSVEKSNK